MAKSTAYRCGVDDFYVAHITVGEDGKLTYGTPYVLGGTASVGVTYTSGENKVYESDVMIRDKRRITGATVNYSSRSVPLEEQMKLFMGETAATAAAGDYEEGPDDVAAPVAVGWAAPRTDGSFLCTWFYYATASQADESYETATENENTPADSFNFGCMPSPETRKLRRRKVCKNEAEKTAFFASVLPQKAAS